MGVGKYIVDKAKHRANGGCKGSSDGKHSFTSTVMKDKITGKKGVRVTYCKNPRCGRVA